MKTQQLIFLDLETTGLGPKAEILELAMIATEIHDGRIEEVDWFSKVIGRADAFFQPAALDMHLHNGLLTDVLDSPYGPHDVSYYASGWLDEIRRRGSKLVMAGNSIHTDRTWLRADPAFAAFEKQFYHRMFDVSAFQSLAETADLPLPDKQMAHRALSDCRESIRLANHWFGVLKAGLGVAL